MIEDQVDETVHRHVDAHCEDDQGLQLSVVRVARQEERDHSEEDPGDDEEDADGQELGGQAELLSLSTLIGCPDRTGDRSIA
ncbi:MAG: hypothetical protein GY738_21105 [Pseudoalteromonas sp.]|nr:hypothetical protein [Pseudoalteromonas sp.]